MEHLQLANACREAEEDIGDVRTGIIYMATCIATGLSYIGYTLDFEKRRYSHKKAVHYGSDTHFHNAIRKYGWDAFAWRILAYGIPLSQLNTLEVFWIRFHNTYLGPGYNMTAGGKISPMHNPEVVAKVGVKSREYWGNLSEEELAVCSARSAAYWNSLSPEEYAEQCKTMSDSQKERWASFSPEEYVEFCEKRAKALQAYYDSQSEDERKEHGRKISEGWDKMSEEARAQHSDNLLAYWDSLSYAEREKRSALVRAGKHAAKQERLRKKRLIAIKTGQAYFC